jgi:hypothetical protein
MFTVRIKALPTCVGLGVVVSSLHRAQARTLTTAASSADIAVRVATYNLLSDGLCRANHYIHSTPEVLDNSARFERVSAQLVAEMQQNSVICLQEVSRHWGAKLVPLLEQHNYGYAAAPYGNAFGGYMGVAVLWPRDRLAIAEVLVEKVTDSVVWAREEDWVCPACGVVCFASKDRCFKCSASKPGKVGAPAGKPVVVATGPVSIWGRLLGSVIAFAAAPAAPAAPAASVPAAGRPPPPPFNAWLEAEKRANCAVGVRLVDRATGQRFAVATYHMPCLFGSDEKCQVRAARASPSSAPIFFTQMGVGRRKRVFLRHPAAT